MAHHKSSGSPLWRHPNGQWTKKHKGRAYYFGADEAEAIRRFNAEWSHIIAGDVPPSWKLTLRDVANLFLAHKEAARDRGELTPTRYKRLFRVCERIVAAAGDKPADGLLPSDFQRIRTNVVASLECTTANTELAAARSVFRFAYTHAHVDRPIRYSEPLKPVANLVISRHNANANRTFTVAEVAELLKHAEPKERFIVLAGINLGYSWADLDVLRDQHFSGSWVALPRPKTGNARKAWAWPETLEAWATFKRVCGRMLAKRFDQLQLRAGVLVEGRGQYGLRHTLATIGSEAGDDGALRAIMGHSDPSTLSHYRSLASDERILKICKFCRAKVLGDSESV